jgi:deazaflavin-dependent oxidoreductase (nitroreductase family)
MASPSAGCSLGPARYPKFVFFYMKFDKLLIRWFGFSLVSWSIMRCNGVKTVPALILYSKGRKSGKILETPITYYRDGSNYAIVGSNGGAKKHPAWVYNIDASPDCEVRVNTRKFKARGHVATGAEYERIWNAARAWYPWFDDYQVTAAPRLIPIVVLERA